MLSFILFIIAVGISLGVSITIKESTKIEIALNSVIRVSNACDRIKYGVSKLLKKK